MGVSSTSYFLSDLSVYTETFRLTVPNYMFPMVNKTLLGEEVDRHIRPRYGSAVTIKKGSEVHENEVPWKRFSDENLLLTSPLVYGFSLSDKLWRKYPYGRSYKMRRTKWLFLIVEFCVDDVTTFEWSDEPFTNLVLAKDQKALILSLVEAHTQGIAHGFDDFVKGKGQGLIVNLFGNPGVGKSLTAEATSERESHFCLTTFVFISFLHLASRCS